MSSTITSSFTNKSDLIKNDNVFGKGTKVYYNPHQEIEIIRNPSDSTRPFLTSTYSSLMKRSTYS